MVVFLCNQNVMSLIIKMNIDFIMSHLRNPFVASKASPPSITFIQSRESGLKFFASIYPENFISLNQLLVIETESAFSWLD